MHHNVAIIGAGITGVMTALACARMGAGVDLYDAREIPNSKNLSWAHGRLWKLIHENNATLQPLAARSLPFWRDLINADNKFGCRTHSLRLADDATCARLAQLYQESETGYDIQERELSVQNSLLKFSDTSRRLFIGSDAILLNARRIYAFLCHQLAQCRNVTLKPGIHVDRMSIREGRRLCIGKTYRHYQRIISTTSTPIAMDTEFPGRTPVAQHQVHLDVYINDTRAALLNPVLNMGDEHQCWCVPSPDRSILKISARRFAYPQPPDEETLLACKEYLLDRLRVNYGKVDVFTSSYFELSEGERMNSPYWHHHKGTGCIQVDACDASGYKIAPALSGQISHYAIHGVKE